MIIMSILVLNKYLNDEVSGERLFFLELCRERRSCLSDSESEKSRQYCN